MNNKVSKMQRYEEIQALVQKDARDEATKVFKQLATQYGINKSPLHYHDGVDLPKINQQDQLNNIKYSFSFNGNGSGTAQIRIVPNIAGIIVNGFAANNLSAPATKRGIFNGNAVFGRCFSFTETGPDVQPNSPLSGVQLAQTSNSMYVDSTTLANNRVSFSAAHIVRVVDETAAEVALVAIDSYDKGVIYVTYSFAADWQAFINLTVF